MAKIVFSENGLLSLVCSSKLKILDCSDGSRKFSCSLSDLKPLQDTTKKNEKTYNGSDIQQDVSLGHGNVSSFSPSGRRYGLCTASKTLVVWRTDTWECLGTRTIEKKATAIAFTSNGDFIVVADKTGDVYKYPVKDSVSKGVLVLGHISMIMDMVLTKDNQFIITAERDEKIRVSHFPNSYSIASYCLGHTDFVSSIKLLPQCNILVSGSGDGSVIFWDFKSGKKVCIRRPQDGMNGRKENSGEESMDSDAISCIACCTTSNNICVIVEKSCALHVYHMNSHGSILELCTLATTVPPWHVEFDNNGLLWCLLPNPEEPLVIYRHEKTREISQYVKIQSFEDIPLYGEVNDWNYLEECVGKDPKLSLLRKRTDIDNMKEYLTRKEERIQQKKAHLAELESKEAKRNKVE